MDRGVLTIDESDLGSVGITPDAVAQIVGHAAAEAYGVVGMGGRRLPRPFGRDKITRGISVHADDGGVAIDMHVVVEHGLKLAEVAATVRSRVVYEVERQTGLPVRSIEVHIDDVRSSS